MADCIYCQKPGKKSREHVFPDFLLKASDARGIFYSNSADGYFDSDAVVRDTCIPCNTGPLSRLDSYAKTLYQRYFARVLVDARTIRFDFDLLLRWVLKVTFNAQRGFGGISRHLLHLRGYMLGKESRPDSLLFLGVAMKRSWVEGKWKTPRDLRACDIRIPELDLGVELYFCHMLVIKSFCFITLDLINPSEDGKRRVVQFLANTIGAREITSNSTEFQFDASISKIDHISHNIRQAAQNPKMYPENREIVIGDKTIRLTGLPEDRPIRRSRIAESKLALTTIGIEGGKDSACLILFKFPASLHEFDNSITDQNHKTSKICYASLKRSDNKTYITLHDPFEPGVPHVKGSSGISQSTDNWNRFKNAVLDRGYLFLTDQRILKDSTIMLNCIEVISIEYI